MDYQPGMVATYVSLKLRRMRQEDSFEFKTSRSPSHPRIQGKDVSQRGGRAGESWLEVCLLCKH